MSIKMDSKIVVADVNSLVTHAELFKLEDGYDQATVSLVIKLPIKVTYGTVIIVTKTIKGQEAIVVDIAHLTPSYPYHEDASQVSFDNIIVGKGEVLEVRTTGPSKGHIHATLVNSTSYTSPKISSAGSLGNLSLTKNNNKNAFYEICRFTNPVDVYGTGKLHINSLNKEVLTKPRNIKVWLTYGREPDALDENRGLICDIDYTSPYFSTTIDDITLSQGLRLFAKVSDTDMKDDELISMTFETVAMNSN